MALALVSVSYPWIETTQLSKNILGQVLKFSDIVEITSIYKRKSDNLVEFESKIEFVISISTHLPSLELSQKLRQINLEVKKERADSELEVLLLVYDKETVMTPELTLPHPKLHYDTFTLRLCSEIWGRYEHPILKQTLRQLSDDRSQDLNIEFLIQGKSLFD